MPPRSHYAANGAAVALRGARCRCPRLIASLARGQLKRPLRRVAAKNNSATLAWILGGGFPAVAGLGEIRAVRGGREMLCVERAAASLSEMKRRSREVSTAALLPMFVLWTGLTCRWLSGRAS